jgi:hypothetical protein
MQKDFSTETGVVLVQFDAENLRSKGYLLATLTATIKGETHTVKIQFTNGESSAVTAASRAAETASVCFDFCGRRVAKPARGLYIVGGRKMMINQ